MVQATIRKEYLTKRLAFGKGANQLHKRSPVEINELAILAHESKSKSLLILFEVLPSLADLKKTKTDLQLQKAAVVVVKRDKQI